MSYDLVHLGEAADFLARDYFLEVDTFLVADVLADLAFEIFLADYLPRVAFFAVDFPVFAIATSNIIQ